MTLEVSLNLQLPQQYVTADTPCAVLGNKLDYKL